MSQYFFNYYSIPYFLSFFVSIFIAGLLFFKKRENKHVQLFIVVQISLAILTLSAALATCSRDPIIWDIWNSINTVFGVLGVTLFYHFSYVSFTQKKVLENKMFLAIYLVPLMFLIFILINPENIVVESPDTDLGIYGKEFTGRFSFYKPVFYGYIGIMLVLTTLNFIRMYREIKNPILKKRSMYFVLSSLIPFIGFLISVLFVEILQIPLHVQLGMVALAVSGVVIAYGILKHQLFDIEFIVKKTFVYLLIALILIGIFRLIELILSYFISATFFGGDLGARFIAAVIVFCFFFPLRSTAVKIGDRLFPKLAKTVKYDFSHEIMVYNNQLKHALEDGVITEKEEKMLKSLRYDLGISDEDHENLLEELTKGQKLEKST
jgi:hypothetical protein